MHHNHYAEDYRSSATIMGFIFDEFFIRASHKEKEKHKKSTLRRRPTNTSFPTEAPIFPKQMKNERCCHCGLIWKNRHKCTAINETCLKCGEKGHFARVCHFLGETDGKNEANINGMGKSSNDKKKSQKEKNERRCGGKSKININDANNATEFNSNTYHKDYSATTKNNGVKTGETNAGGVGISKKTTFNKPKCVVNETSTKQELIIQTKETAAYYYQLKKYNLALSKYSELITLSPNSENYYGNRAACHMMMGRYDNAISDAKKAIELNPKYLKGHLRVVKSAMALGNFIEAESGIRQLEKINPANALIASERKKIGEIQVYLNQADAASMKNNYDEALKNIDKALEMSTHCVAYKIKKGEYLAQLERYKDAETVANDILNYEPSNVDAKYILGICIYQSDADKAVSYFNHILRLAPDDPKILIVYKKAKVLITMKKTGNDAFRKKNYSEAYDLYTEALKIDPDNRGMNKILYYNQSQASYKLGKIQRAIVECTKALSIDPHYVKALMRRGQCYIDQKEYEEAIVDFRKACEIDTGKDCQNLLREAEKLQNAAKSDYHGILGVKRNASHAEIKKAYKKKALMHHPDRHVNSSYAEKIKNEKTFKQITQAYRLLINRYEKEKAELSDEFNSYDEDYMSDEDFGYWYGNFNCRGPRYKYSNGENSH